MPKSNSKYQLFCPLCITEMLHAETLEQGLVFICPKCGFQLNIDLTELAMRKAGDDVND